MEPGHSCGKVEYENPRTVVSAPRLPHGAGVQDDRFVQRQIDRAGRSSEEGAAPLAHSQGTMRVSEDQDGRSRMHSLKVVEARERLHLGPDILARIDHGAMMDRDVPDSGVHRKLGEERAHVLIDSSARPAQAGLR